MQSIETPITASTGLDLRPTQVSLVEQRKAERDAEVERQRKVEQTPFSEYHNSGVELNHIWVNLDQTLRMQGFDIDQDFTPDYDRLQRTLAEQDIPPEWIEEFDDVVSEQHQLAKLSVLSERAANERKLVEAGLWGVTAYLSSSFSDPIGFAIDAAAAPLGAAGKASRLGRIAGGAAAAGASNAAVGSTQGLADPDYDFGSLAADATVGFVLGGGLTTAGMLLNSAERKEWADALFRAQNRAKTERAFGPDSAGAARVAGTEVPQLDTLNTALGENRARDAIAVLDDNEHLAYINEAVGKSLRIDMMRHIESAKDRGRTLMRLLHSSPVGVEEGATNVTGAVERTERNRRVMGARFQTGYKGAYRDWLKEQGSDGFMTRQFSLTKAEEFNRAVAKAMRSGTDSPDPAVAKAQQVIRQSLSDAYDRGVKAGVRGMAPESKIPNYFPRTLRRDLRRFIHEDLSGRDSAVIEEGLSQLFTEAVTRGLTREGIQADEAVTAKVGAAYAKRVLGFSDSPSAMIDSMTEQRLDYLDELLEEAGLSDDGIQRIMAQLIPKKEQANAVPSNRLKHRLPMDETVEYTFEDGRTISVADFFDDNAERVVDNYLREMSGHVGLAETGFQSWREVDAMASQLYATGELNDEAYRVSQKLLKSVLGRPMEDGELSGGARAARMVLDANFLRAMGSVSFAMLAENGKILGMAGMRAVLQQIPEMRKVIDQALKGKLDDELAREMAAMWAPGSSMLRTSVNLRPEDLNLPGVEGGVLGSLDRVQQQAKRLQTMVSGLGPITDIQQVFTSRAVMQRLYNHATSGQLPRALRGRLMDYGLTTEDVSAFMRHLKTHGKAENGVLVGMAAGNMKADLHIKVSEAMSRMVRHVIQEQDVGAVPEFLHQRWGKIIAQFRSFPIAAYSRHTLHGIGKHDSIAAVGFTTSMAFGALGYVGMVYAQHGNNPEYMSKMLTEDRIAKAAFSRAADASLIPGIVDTITNLGGSGPVFAHARTTGMAGDLATGNPTVDFFMKLQKAAGIPANAIRTDRKVTEEQVRALMSLVWLNRLPGLMRAQHMIAEQFPSAYEAKNDRR